MIVIIFTILAILGYLAYKELKDDYENSGY